MAGKYKTDTKFSPQVRYLTVLIFVPDYYVIDTFEKLCDGLCYLKKTFYIRSLNIFFSTSFN